MLRAGERAAQRSVLLPCATESAARARHELGEFLEATGTTAWRDAAELAVTEVVSNAVLHAHTEVQLTMLVDRDDDAEGKAEGTARGTLRVEVRDFNPTLPQQRSYTEQASTGRGMALVAALTCAHGVSDVDANGKTVWFTLTGTGPTAEPSVDELLDAWSDAVLDVDWEQELAADAAAGRAGARCVLLRRLPPTLWLAAHQHHDALIRELVLYLAAHDGLDVDVAAADRARSAVSMAVRATVEAARRAGRTQRPVPPGHPSPLEDTPAPFDLELTVDLELAPAFLALQDALDAAEQLARDGLLLARPGLPEIVALRDWACEQVTAQLAGVAPSAWPGTDQPRFADERDVVGDHPGASPAWDLALVRESDRGVVAADDSNRILAISRPLAQLTGREPDDLVGRRVVALIPHRLREAHVAGFTRHLTTGEAHVLDVPLQLPVLRADGIEVTCRFLVQLAAQQGGHNLYHAWVEPLPPEPDEGAS